jgi:hypothetical protein
MSDKGNSKKEVDRNFLETIEILNYHRVSYWVCHGTLLGIIRDGALIPWDHDIDIAVWADSVTKIHIINLMSSRNYVLKHDGYDFDFLTFTKDGGREVDFNFYRTSQDKKIAFSEWFISRSKLAGAIGVLARASTYSGQHSGLIRKIAFVSPIFHWLEIFLKKNKLLYRSAGYTTPVNLLSDVKYITIDGTQVSVPLLSEDVLEYVYGMDWRTPKEVYDWTKESPSTKISKERF